MPDSPIQFVFMLFADDVFDPIIQFIQSTVKGFHCLVSNISHSSICSLLNGKPKIDLQRPEPGEIMINWYINWCVQNRTHSVLLRKGKGLYLYAITLMTQIIRARIIYFFNLRCANY